MKSSEVVFSIIHQVSDSVKIASRRGSGSAGPHTGAGALFTALLRQFHIFFTEISTVPCYSRSYTTSGVYAYDTLLKGPQVSDWKSARHRFGHTIRTGACVHDEKEFPCTSATLSQPAQSLIDNMLHSSEV